VDGEQRARDGFVLFVSVSVDEERYAYYAMSGEHPDSIRALEARAHSDTLDSKGE
jgi:hypothetical protein